MQIEEILELIPSKEGYERDIPMSEAQEMGIHFCGDFKEGIPVHKFLAKERVMLTYHQIGKILYHVETLPLSD